MHGPLLLGEYEFTIDAKGRVAIPARFRPVFAEGIFLTRGFDHCLSAYAPEQWERFVEDRTGELPEMSSRGRQVRRFVFAGLGDRMSTFGQARRLWEHWDRPSMAAYAGGHVGFFWSSAVRRLVDQSVRATLATDA